MVLKLWIQILWTIIYFSVSNVDATIDLTATPYLKTFDSHDTYGSSNYPGNYSRDWLITGETANYTITIEFLQCTMETGNNKGVCIQDNVLLYDGSNRSASLLQETCCGIGHVATVQSTGGTMYIIFETDDTISAAGFRISYILEGAPTTTDATTAVVAAATQEQDNTIYIIIACAVTGLLIIIIIVLICIICCKKKSKKRPKHKILKKSNQQPVVVTSEAGSEIELNNESHLHQVLTVQTAQTTSPPPAYASVVNEQTVVGKQSNANGGKSDQSKSTKATYANTSVKATNGDHTTSTKDMSKAEHKEIVQKSEIKQVTVLPKSKIKNSPTQGKSDNRNSTKEQKRNETTAIELNPLNTTLIKEHKSEKKTATMNTTIDETTTTERKSVNTNTIKQHKSGKVTSDTYNKSEKNNPPKEQMSEMKTSTVEQKSEMKTSTVEQKSEMKTATVEQKSEIKTATVEQKSEMKTSTVEQKSEMKTSTVEQKSRSKPLLMAQKMSDNKNTPNRKIFQEKQGITIHNETDVHPTDQIENIVIKNKVSSDKSEIRDDETVQNDNNVNEERSLMQNMTIQTQSTLEQTDNKEIKPCKQEGTDNDKETVIRFNNSKKANSDIPRIQPVVPYNNSLITHSDNTRNNNLNQAGKSDTNSKTQKNKNNNKTEQNNSKNNISKNLDSTVASVSQTKNKAKDIKQNDTRPIVTWDDKGKETEIQATFLSIDNTFDASSIEARNEVIQIQKKGLAYNQTQQDHKNDIFNPYSDREVEHSDDSKNIYGDSNQNHYLLTRGDGRVDLKVEKNLKEPDKKNKQTEIYSQKLNKNDANKKEKEQNYRYSDINKNKIQHGEHFIEKEDSVTNLDFKMGNNSANEASQNNLPMQKQSSTKAFDEPSIFTISNGVVSNFDKPKSGKSIKPKATYYNQPITDTSYSSDESKQNRQKLQWHNYDEKLETLMSIYHSHSNNGRNDKTLSRTRTQPHMELPKQQPPSRINPWLVSSKEDSSEVKSNKQVTKATVMRRMRTMGVQEFEDENIPQLIPKSHVLNILRSRTTLCDEEITAPRKRVLPPLKGIPKQELPELPHMWMP